MYKSLLINKKLSLKVKAFTMIELLLSVALITMFAAVAAPIYQSFQFNNELETASNLTMSTIRTAQSFAINGKNDDHWGIKFTQHDLYIFKGSDFASRDSTYDYIYPLGTNINTSGLGEIIFAKSSGLPNIEGNISLSNNLGKVTTFNLNEKGTLDY